LEELHPEPNLFGRDAKERAAVLMWNDIATLEGYLALHEVLRNAHPAFAGRALPGPIPYPQIPALAERGRERSGHFFDRLERRLAVCPHLAGERFSYADIVAYVYTGFGRRALGEDPVARRPNLDRWARAVEDRPAIRSAG
jgi:glutathione S-transferase